MEIYIGLDVSLATTAICVLGEKGKIVTEAQVASAPDSLVPFLDELPHDIAAIGLEAGPLSHWLHKGLTDAGFEAVLMETRQVKAALKAMPIKTDRRDAEGIARLLQMGWFRPVHCKTVSSQEMRALLTSRKSVQNVLVNLELSLRGGASPDVAGRHRVPLHAQGSDGASHGIGAAASHRHSIRRRGRAAPEGGEPPVSPRRDAVPDNACGSPCLPSRPMAIEHA